MAVPTQPTKTTIVTEAYKKAGILSPTSAELTRAQDEWLEEIKHEISQKKAGQWWILQETATISVSQQRHLLPADFGSAIRGPMVIINAQSERDKIDEVPIQTIDDYVKPLTTGIPKEYAIHRGEIHLYPVPDLSSYTLQLRYWLDILKVDYTSAKHAEILLKWRNPLVLGVYWKALQDIGDGRELSAEASFWRAVNALDTEDAKKKVSTLRTRVTIAI